MPTQVPQPIAYQIVVAGQVKSQATSQFDCRNLVTSPTHSQLTLNVSDQTELHGFLSYLRDYNLHLVSLNQLGHFDSNLAPRDEYQPKREMT